MRSGSDLREGRRVERRYYVNATPAGAWAALHDPANEAALYPELALGPAETAWPAAGAIRLARLRVGLLREPVFLESLEARPAASFRLRLIGADVRGELGWRFDAVAGGTRVVHDAVLEPTDRFAAVLVRIGRGSLADRVEDHLRALKVRAEASPR